MMIAAALLIAAPAVAHAQQKKIMRTAPEREYAVDVAMPVDSGRPVIEATINGQGPFSFIFDTGAGITVLRPALVEQLGLEPTGSMRVGDPSAPEAVETNTYTVDSITVGGVTFADITVIEIASMRGIPLDGVIGMPLFADWIITMDFPNERFKLSPEPLTEGDGSLAYEPDNGSHIYLPVDVAGEIVMSHIDTGSPGEFMLPLSVAEKLPLTSEPQLLGQARTVSSTFDIYHAELDGEASLSMITARNPSLNFTDRFSWGNIGTGALVNATVHIDQANQRFLAMPTGDGTRKATNRFGRPRYGVGLGPDGDSLVVRLVSPNSIAANAGVQTGDVILKINDKDASDFDEAGQRAAFQSSPITLLIERDGEKLEITMKLE